MVRTAFARFLARVAPLMETKREGAESRERIRFGRDDLADVVPGLADGFLEQGEHQFVLAVEVLVEAAQRLLRPVDDLLDRELGRAFLVDQLERGIEEALHPLLGAGTGRVHAAGDGALAPGRLARVGGIDSGHVRAYFPVRDDDNSVPV